jgi:hypothetical protein
VSFCDLTERPYLKAIEKLMKATVAVAVHDLAETREDAMAREATERLATKANGKRRKRYRGRRPNGPAGAGKSAGRKSHNALRQPGASV